MLDYCSSSLGRIRQRSNSNIMAAAADAAASAATCEIAFYIGNQYMPASCMYSMGREIYNSTISFVCHLYIQL